MVRTLKIYLPEEAMVTLEDKYITEEDPNALHRLIFGYVRSIARNAKLVLTQGEMMAQLFDQESNKYINKSFPLKELQIQQIKFDEKWKPESKGPDLIPYELKVGDKTSGLLEKSYEHFLERVRIFNESIPQTDPDRKNKILIASKCFEAYIHDALIGSIMQEVSNSIDGELDKEFNEIYPMNKPEAK